MVGRGHGPRTRTRGSRDGACRTPAHGSPRWPGPARAGGAPELRQHNTLYSDRYTIPALQEVIDLAQRHSQRRDRPIGLYLETKHPSYFDSTGLSLEEPLDRALERNDLDDEDAPVFLQSFEVGNPQQLNSLAEVALVQLIAGSGAPFDLASSGDPRTYDDLIPPQGLEHIASYADGIGPDKDRIVPRDASGHLQQPTELVDRAHQQDLAGHPYTFRNENTFLPADFREGDNPAAFGDAFAEYALFYDLGVDGLFTDHPDTAAIARRGFSRRRSPRRQVTSPWWRVRRPVPGLVVRSRRGWPGPRSTGCPAGSSSSRSLVLGAGDQAFAGERPARARSSASRSSGTSLRGSVRWVWSACSGSRDTRSLRCGRGEPAACGE